MKECVFDSLEKGTACRNGCGRKLARTFTSHPLCKCGPKEQCKHLGERKPATLKVLCTTCKGVNNIDQPVNACAIYGRCLPEFRPTGEAADRWYGNEEKGIERRFEADAYHVCMGCASRELVEIALPPAQPGG